MSSEAKKRLIDNVTKRTRTVMIGSLDIIEKELLQNNSDMNLRSVYDSVRKKILDLGNTQIRNIEWEIDNYTIEQNRVTLSYNVNDSLLRNRKEGNG